ncbi:hypothetical protein R6Q59_006712 [Mikania micrantha]
MENENFMESQSLSSQTVVRQNYSARDVAIAFAEQYYQILQETPKLAHNFYKDQSMRSHPCADGSTKSVTTLKDIDDEIMASYIKQWNPDLTTMYAQDSLMESVIVGVTGSLITNDDVARNFAQTFFLAPQEGGGFYVHNDFLQFIEIEKISETSPPLDDVTNPPAAQHDDPAKDSTMETAEATNKDQTEKSTSSKEDVDTKDKVSESLEGKNPLPTEPKKKNQPSVWKSAPSAQDSKKASYASVLAKEGSGSSTTQTSTNAIVKVSPKTEQRVITSSVASKSPINSVKSSAISNNGPLENIFDLKAIRVKDLPPKMTQESLLEVVKQFGSVKQKNIQIKEYSQDGYRYAFVEFDNLKSARTAVETHFIRFEDRVSEIQYKKISNPGGHNHMGQPQRGGLRNDNFWGREGGEGRSNGSWGNKNIDHDNFGQHSGQTRDNNNRRNRYLQDRR